MQFSTKIDGFEQKDSQGFENSYNSYEQYPLEKFFIFTIYQNYTLAKNVFTYLLLLILLFVIRGKGVCSSALISSKAEQRFMLRVFSRHSQVADSTENRRKWAFLVVF